MRKGSTTFLKVVVVIIALAVVALCIFVLPMIARAVAGDQTFAKWVYPVLIGMYISVIPFFVAMFQSIKLLGYIDKNEAFSDMSVKALRVIKYSALTISLVYTATMPFFFMIGELDDAPGVIVIGMVLVFASFVVAVFAYVLQNILKSALDIKSENDLTV
ncbi:DUF2975 domain-containing protein [Halalkalibacillus sediminis]|uniref:DUF2975 domain-containing protein n=1 Tax=Halalkalibacillus sediminis TaxID=2018042 RepID=A0A2I0QQW5_9BACI|nr:DUF2975 domain-containing protein [Halalkalibacillus sediminis]PKR76726.1 DUF2975 domain-containing protein [Halalkalibacillus sediminis]